MSSFRINYSQVISQAEKIKNLAGDLKTQINALESLAKDVKANWQGLASEALLNQMETLRYKMSSTSRKMADVSKTIKDVASKIQREDEDAAAQVRGLSNKN